MFFFNFVNNGYYDFRFIEPAEMFDSDMPREPELNFMQPATLCFAIARVLSRVLP